MVPDLYSVLLAMRDRVESCGVDFINRETIILTNDKRIKPELYVELSINPGTTLPRSEFDYITPAIVNCVVVTTHADGSEQVFDIIRQIGKQLTANQDRRETAKAKFNDRDGNLILIRRAEQRPFVQDEHTFRVNFMITIDILSKG